MRLLCDRILVMYLGRIVESGPADRVFAAPAHPYTQALLSAVPKPGVAAAAQRRIGLPGEPRSPIDPDPAVCPLYGRCGRATDLCRSRMPPLREVGPGRLAACHFPSGRRGGCGRRRGGRVRGQEMHTETGDLGAYVDTAAVLIGLSLDPAHRPGVLLNMQRIAEMAALVMEFPLPDACEPAPVFLP